jgi:hypothetical protein
VGGALLVAAAEVCAPALAYRPFDGNDAAVADQGQIGIEFEPVGYVHEGVSRSLIAPQVVFIYGFATNWEASLQGEASHGLTDDLRPHALLDTKVSAKGVLREGSLQDKSGPSLATEVSVLLPEAGGDRGAGAGLALIASQRFEAVTVHLNLAGTLTRQKDGDLFTGIIVEGPREWPVRPVAEVLRERDFGGDTVVSGLIGAIWEVSDRIALDGGYRHGRVGDRKLKEFRAGMSISLP